MECYIGQIALFAFPRVPIGWLACDGSLVAISDYEALFTLIGTTYGGNGQTNFALPDLRGRVPLHQGQGSGLSPRVIGERAGTEQVTLLQTQLPQHAHALTASTTTATTAVPSNAVGFAAGSNQILPYAPNTAVSTAEVMAAAEVTVAGQNLPHNNVMPTTFCSYCIAYVGTYPSQG